MYSEKKTKISRPDFFGLPIQRALTNLFKRALWTNNSKKKAFGVPVIYSLGKKILHHHRIFLKNILSLVSISLSHLVRY